MVVAATESWEEGGERLQRDFQSGSAVGGGHVCEEGLRGHVLDGRRKVCQAGEHGGQVGVRESLAA